MPNARSTEPVVPANLFRPGGAWQRVRKGQPVLIGTACFAVLQLAGIILGKTGSGVDPTAWRNLSAGIGALAFIVSGSPLLILGARLVGLRIYCSIHLISETEYARMRKSVEQAFEARILGT